jgi:putative hydrolase of the HAD superfamily
MSIAGVVFDIGGVVQDSPLHAIARYERGRGIAPGTINRAVVEAGERGAWARLERGELTVAAFCEPFEAECRSRGVAIDAQRLMAAIAEAGVPRPRVLEAIRRIRARGLRVAALTNNWASDAPGSAPARGARALWEHFDVVVESAVVGLRKPDPRIYALVGEKLALAPARVAFLDDIGRNLKPARELGMATIKVDDPDAALRELGTLLGFDLIG